MRTVTYKFPKQTNRKIAELEEVFGTKLIDALKLQPLVTEGEAKEHARKCAQRQFKAGETINGVLTATLVDSTWTASVEINECASYNPANPLTWTPPAFPVW